MNRSPLLVVRMTILCMCVILSGCRRQSASIVPITASYEESAIDLLVLSARMSDVSLPLGVHPRDRSIGKDNPVIIASFEAKFPTEVIADFYTLDMERLGWQQIINCIARDGEILTIFEKPQKMCTVRITSVTGSTCSVTCYVSPKNIDRR